MIPGGDGRTYACEYCDAKVLVAVDGGQIAQGMALDLANIDTFLTQLADALSTTIPEHLKVQRHGAHVVAIEIAFPSDVFLAKRDPQGIVAQQKKLVRGVALKTATHPLDHWYEQLMRALAKLANENARAGAALSRLGRR